MSGFYSRNDSSAIKGTLISSTGTGLWEIYFFKVVECYKSVAVEDKSTETQENWDWIFGKICDILYSVLSFGTWRCTQVV